MLTRMALILPPVGTTACKAIKKMGGGLSLYLSRYSEKQGQEEGNEDHATHPGDNPDD